VHVLVDRFRATRIQAVTVKQEPGAAAVILNQANEGFKNPLRRRVDLAHELGHVLFDELHHGIRVAVDLGIELNRSPTASGHPPEEQRANAFAAELLIPLRGLVRLFGAQKLTKGAMSYAEAVDRVQQAREEFKTPAEVAVNHLCWRGYIDPSLRDALLSQKYPKTGPVRERYMGAGVIQRRVLFALRQGHITASRARELLGLSVWDDLPGGGSDGD
jgi:Zn-dependent peptidase ImmA (M78 family)